MTKDERERCLQYRALCGHPRHSPPHFGTEDELYHITAACYEHRSHLADGNRRSEFETLMVKGLRQDGIAAVHAWVVLPNHYHLLLKTRLAALSPWIRRLHNTTSTRWNREDARKGRKVWSPYADRRIRGDIHYYRTLNYIHTNPVKHRCVGSARDWPWSSFAAYEARFGREQLLEWWKSYPIDGYGRGWDD